MFIPERIKSEIFPIMDRVCKKYKVNRDWVIAIISQESHWEKYAVRYERNYKYLYKPEKFTHVLNSLDTEVVMQMSSFGLGQVMGALAREQGHMGYLSELTIPEVNITHMCIRLNYLQRRNGDPAFIFAGYNGGPGAMQKGSNGLFINQKYVDNVTKYLTKLV